MSKPACFGSPERCDECAQCGVRAQCYQRHARTSDVFLLPMNRPAPEHKATWGSAFATPFQKTEPKS